MFSLSDMRTLHFWMYGNDEGALGRRDTSEEAANLNLACFSSTSWSYNLQSTWYLANKALKQSIK
ncbi:hypothetical protein DAPPUDRAFT_242284 [Daphnia pulex]|uniref:Uncharacterized protein n=1 Tax=Daphnia pulex TaxID=6669 RepID=E9GGA5_DAPPU|nr:hypothetical protein DAPPUDRAFT_242284 [Daphnia pulex]|eukprot:EFX81530.1 hypothetical protein DAPPUDRAFT_242284 [Daphnia pulex]